MTREEFKKRWESDEDGGGITYEDIAECAKEWGLFDNPRLNDIVVVTEAVVAEAGTSFN